MQLTISSVDYAPEDLYEQVPLVVELLRELPGDDRPDYWLGELQEPVQWLRDNLPNVIKYVVLAARWEGTQIDRGVESLPVGIAYVVDESILSDEHLSFSKCEYVAIGLAHDTGGDSPVRSSKGVVAGTIGRFFGTGNQQSE